MVTEVVVAGRESWWLTVVEARRAEVIHCSPTKPATSPVTPSKIIHFRRSIHYLAVRTWNLPGTTRILVVDLLWASSYSLNHFSEERNRLPATGEARESWGVPTVSMSNSPKHLTSPALDSWFKLGKTAHRKILKQREVSRLRILNFTSLRRENVR